MKFDLVTTDVAENMGLLWSIIQLFTNLLVPSPVFVTQAEVTTLRMELCLMTARQVTRVAAAPCLDARVAAESVDID